MRETEWETGAYATKPGGELNTTRKGLVRIQMHYNTEHKIFVVLSANSKIKAHRREQLVDKVKCIYADAISRPELWIILHIINYE